MGASSDTDTTAAWSRRQFVGGAGTLVGAAALSRATRAGAVMQPPPDAFADRSVLELRALFDHGGLTVVVAVQGCLERIDRLDKRGPAINAVIELNPQALAIAAARDAELRAGRPRGPLHGIPVLLKDNIDSADQMKTSAGSLALAHSTARRDARIVERLRQAGAVILGKTNLSEWANFRSTRSTSGWSARGGLTKNPHVLDRNTSGSSSGTAAALAAGFAPLGVGTETDGSIISPSSVCGIVGIKPTVGLCGRSGIIPISPSQDTAGPMARTVADAAALLGALAAVDPLDPATHEPARRAESDYTRYLDARGLAGARLGVPRNLAGFHPDVDRAFDRAILAMKDAGAVILDELALPTAQKFDDAELDVLLYEFKASITTYLAALGPGNPVKTLVDLIAFNQAQRDREMPWFGQELFERAQKKGPLNQPAYRAARDQCVKMARQEGLDLLLGQHRLDAIIVPSNQPAWITDLLNGDHVTGGNTSFAAVAGYPSITVPMGFTHDLPLGLSFIGPAWSEGTLIKLAYAFEQQTHARQPPHFLPTVSA
jgi:amidase